MAKLSKVPDVLPNNMKHIRRIRGVKTGDICKDLSLNNNYISQLENYKVNISGKLAFKLMRYFNVTFEQLFNIRQTIKLPFCVDLYRDIILIIDIDANHLDQPDGKNIIKINKEIKKKLNENGEKGKLFKFEILHISKNIDSDLLNVIFDVILIDKTYIEKEIEIDLLSDVNYDLLTKLNEKKFIDKEEIILNKEEFARFQNGDLLNYHGKHLDITDKLDINSKSIDFKYYEDKGTESINITIVYKNNNNIKYIERYLGITPSYVAEFLEISNESYNKLVKGELNLSTKVMWQLVRLFEVPLQLIINIPLYFENFVSDKSYT